VTGELADLAGKAAAQAAAVLRNGRRALPKALSGRMRGRLRRALDELAVTIERTGTIIRQARTRLAGQTLDGATRLVSLHDLGVRTVAIPRQATTSAARKKLEHNRGFHQLVKWRTGCEGRISYLKRGYGWDRTRLDTWQGATIWCGHGVFAHNLVKIAALAS
jgi:transposase, IS5 family